MTSIVNTTHVSQNNIYFKIHFVLIKNMTDKVMLEILFIYSLYSFISKNDGITTSPFGQKIKFKFTSKIDINIDKSLKSLVSAITKNLISNNRKYK